MWHRVAALFGRPVAELRMVLSSAEFSDWCAFYEIEPWGWHADNWRMSVLASTTANFSGRAKKHVKPSDFLPSSKRRRRMTHDELRAQIEAIGSKDG